MSTANKAEQAVAFAALILADEKLEVTPEKLQTVLQAAGVEDVEPIWIILFAKTLERKDVEEIVTTVGLKADHGATQDVVEDNAAQPDEPHPCGDSDSEIESDDGYTGFLLFD